ncbi:DNase I-like protein [Aureobasidium pullulans]|uniref:DNase I-like protein n=1 Tax=Aureobasidium pullulans TaxID=5580 RepID=A0A4S8S3R5_AURPU|nr:DNase I-like protein [Aureobasidium pullulans]
MKTGSTYLQFLAAAALAGQVVSAETIAQINGNKYLSPYNGKNVTNVNGLVTAKGPSGIWIRSTAPDSDERSSESVYVFDRNFGKNLTVGDVIQLNGTVTEYRSSKAYVYLTEIINPKLVQKISSGSAATPRVIGKDTLSPPNKAFSALDNGDVFGVPNNVSLISVSNPTLVPRNYGMDFWESLSGELVTVKSAHALTKPNNYGDTWVVGDWKVTGLNSRGGLTTVDKDANPEAIIIGSPLDGSKNPAITRVGDTLGDITGIVSYSFGYYTILPLTALNVVKAIEPRLPPPTTLISSGDCSGLTVGSYNVENLWAGSAHLVNISDHIVNYLRSPNLIFVQEIQDNNGETNDAVVTANLTLTTLTSAISSIGGPEYEFVEIDPVDDKDGGAPGGNIRQAYLYSPDILQLRKPNFGASTEANEVLPGPELKYNPGRIDPQNPAWTASRKPLVAEFETLDGKNSFFTINVHFGSKGGSSSIEGDARPPVNGGVEDRQEQMELTANFVADILAEDKNANIIAAGDFNEFAFVEPLENFLAISNLRDMDEAANIPQLERYTYLFDMNSQELDHMYISQALKPKAQYEHVHINTWVTLAEQISDHDPSVAKLNVCKK